jgi:iron complex outermembrane receptor protein
MMLAVKTAGVSWRGTLNGVAMTVAVGLLMVSAAGAADRESFTIEGMVMDRLGGFIAGAAIAVDGGKPVSLTDSDGEFSVELQAGAHELQVSHPAHQARIVKLTIRADVSGFEIVLPPALSLSEAITVSAIRAGEEIPVTKRNMAREEIKQLGYGQDLPKLLQHTPSITWYSDSGIGSNYSYLSLRGIQQNRINMTFDGAPLNDPAEHAVFFNNFHDFASAVDSIQIQRGVGTSSVGAPSYGGSVNFASLPFSEGRGGEARLELGSFDTTRASFAYESGISAGGFSALGRVSYGETEGYRDNSGSEHTTVFANFGWQGNRSSLKLVSFFGDEQSQLSFLAVDPETLEQNPRFNPLDEEERDHFGQDFVQLQFTHAISDHTVLVASAYYNAADGWFRLWDDPVVQNEMLEFGIDQYFVGSMVSLSTSTDRFSTSLGAHYSDFQGEHSLDVEGERVYVNTGFKDTANAFVKADYRLGSWLLFGDLQLRWAEFEYEGGVELGSVDWSFVDPRVGFRRTISPNLSVYASIGRARREPARLDLLLGEDDASVEHDLEAVKPEEVIDVEAGLNVNTPRLALQASLYSMDFDNEIALTGELSEVGLPLRRNVDNSFRRGLEIDLRWIVGRKWTIIHASNLSHNRIKEWAQFYDVYDSSGEWIGSEPVLHFDVPPLLTPEVIINQGIEWLDGEWSAGLMARYVGDAHLDNTGDDRFRAPSYFNIDLRASLTLSRWRAFGRPTISLYVNNLLDDTAQYPSGYSYQFITRGADGRDTVDGIPYYYPLASRSFIVKVELDL